MKLLKIQEVTLNEKRSSIVSYKHPINSVCLEGETFYLCMFRCYSSQVYHCLHVPPLADIVFIKN